MNRLLVTFATALAVVATGCQNPGAVDSLGDQHAIDLKKGGGNGPPGNEDPGIYSITDLGADGGIRDINSVGLLVGSRPGEPDPNFGSVRATAWDLVGTTYTVRDLPQLAPDANLSWTDGVNDVGQIVGLSNDGYSGTWFPVLWEPDGTIRVLPSLVAGSLSQTRGVNDLGQVAGMSQVDDIAHAVFWETEGGLTITALAEPPGHTISAAEAINNAGHIVGVSRQGNDNASERALFWETSAPGTVLVLDDGDYGPSGVDDLSDPDAAGVVSVVGSATTSSGVSVATVWQVLGGSVVAVQQLDLGGASSSGEAINDVGQVLVSTDGSAAVWTLATNLIEPLPTLSSRCLHVNANAIHDDGTVVGSSAVRRKSRCVARAVIWTPTN